MNSVAGKLTADQYSQAAARIMQRCHTLGEYSEDPHGLTRTFCCAPMAAVHRRLKEWMADQSMKCHVDALGNLIGRAKGNPEYNRQASRCLMIGSHLDTVVNAGRFDGTLGVLLGLGAVELLRLANVQLPFDLDIVGFSEEEGVRYKTPFLGSRAIAGEFTKSLLELTDSNKVSVKAALEQFGVDGALYESAAYSAATLIGFIEAHIEQGPVLQELGLPVAVVSDIAGQTRCTFRFSGQVGHAGTVPHASRHDALAAAAEATLAIEQIGSRTDGLFATVGFLNVWPNVPNVIPGLTDFRLDLRHANDAIREGAFAEISSVVEEIAKRRQIDWTTADCEQQPAVPMNEALTDRLALAIQRSGNSVHCMVSGAGHDAVIMARRTASAMLFVRCEDGISHRPEESVAQSDVAVALEVMVNMVVDLASAEAG